MFFPDNTSDPVFLSAWILGVGCQIVIRCWRKHQPILGKKFGKAWVVGCRSIASYTVTTSCLWNDIDSLESLKKLWSHCQVEKCMTKKDKWIRFQCLVCILVFLKWQKHITLQSPCIKELTIQCLFQWSFFKFRIFI